MKEIKDYLHLYLGCEAMYKGYGDPARIVKVFGVSLRDGAQFQFQHNGEVDTDGAIEYFKPILRSLSSLTEDEKQKAIRCGEHQNIPWMNDAIRTQYLLSLGIDLFGLTEEGLAIDETTINK